MLRPEQERKIDAALTWPPGALPLRIVQRLISESVSDLWDKCLRGSADNPANQYARHEMFSERLAEIITKATGHRYAVQHLGEEEE